MFPQFPPKALLAGVRRVKVNLEVPSNADLLPLTGWRLQVEDSLRKKGLTIAEQGESTDALVKVWLSLINVCSVRQGHASYELYSYVCQLAVYSCYHNYSGDMVIGYDSVAHGSTSSDSLVRHLEQTLMNQAAEAGEALKK